MRLSCQSHGQMTISPWLVARQPEVRGETRGIFPWHRIPRGGAVRRTRSVGDVTIRAIGSQGKRADRRQQHREYGRSDFPHWSGHHGATLGSLWPQ